MNRQRLAAIVQALLSKTVENGATEEEALAAAQKAQEFMDRYHLDHGALGMETEGTHEYRQPSDWDTAQIKFLLLSRIAQFTDTRCWRNGPGTKKHGTDFTFFGLKSDTDFASWLLESLSTFVVQQSTAYRLACILDDPLDQLTKDGEASFQLGCIDRINERLRALVEARKTTATGRALIPLKNQIVERDFRKLGIRLTTGTSRLSGADSRAHGAGRAAGDRASFGRPVSAQVRGLLK